MLREKWRDFWRHSMLDPKAGITIRAIVDPPG